MIESKLIRARRDLVEWEGVKKQQEAKRQGLLKSYVENQLKMPSRYGLFSNQAKREKLLRRHRELRREAEYTKEQIEVAERKIADLTRAIQEYEGILEKADREEMKVREDLEKRLQRRRERKAEMGREP
ncbi:hypothetical protein QMT40_002852 [Parvibaculaceae bacterium PLY_AMNH_Bact1]|nr:hypothetical protein QMT40_002852 [Parvibaculaceae bacterium PLY_AMNH_Bact1]